MNDYQDFFEKMADYRIKAGFYDNVESFEIEELYRAFKSRMIDELAVDNPDFRVMGLLKDKP